jgi:hypothetical protein
MFLKITRKNNRISIERKKDYKTTISYYSLDKFEKFYSKLPDQIKNQDGEVVFTDDKNYKPIEEKHIWKTYFDHNFGVFIDSPIKLREIEKKNQGQYYSVDDFKKLNIQKDKEKDDMLKAEIKETYNEYYPQLLRGKSFVAELRKQGYIR